jgi:S-DNA-T family DNA segregation ATPase FtsK/SpoIIIE
MLYTNGNDVVQCAFIDTPEVEKITDFIGHKKHTHRIFTSGVCGEDSGINLDVDISERDTLFREAAEILSTHNKARHHCYKENLKLGYNRAGRLIDQLEAACRTV